MFTATKGLLQKSHFSMSFLSRMSHQLTSHHRALFSPNYFSGTCAHITTSSVNRVPFDVENKDEFRQKVLESSKPMVVDFHASWCNPCKILQPILDDVIAKQEGKVDLAKVDVDKLTDLAVEYGVGAVPTVLGIKDGEVIWQFQGVKEALQIKDFIDKLTKN